MTDSDPDGKHIELLILALLLKHLPKLITAGKVYVVQSPLWKITNIRGTKYYYSNSEAKGKTGERIHFKGLGELNPQELYETTLNPENRRLLQLQADDLTDINNLFDILMGKSSESRKKFILSKGISNLEGENFDEDDDE